MSEELVGPVRFTVQLEHEHSPSLGVAMVRVEDAEAYIERYVGYEVLDDPERWRAAQEKLAFELALFKAGNRGREEDSTCV